VAAGLSVALLAGCGGGDGDAGAATTTVAPRYELVDPAQANDLLAAPPSGLVVLDVRTPEEFAAGHLAHAQDLDFQSSTFAADLARLDRSVPYFVYCHSGNRSAKAVAAMRQLGFTDITELDGGIAAWQTAGYPIVGT
jgi:rhodanese-related sulfurtransferase